MSRISICLTDCFAYPIVNILGITHWVDVMRALPASHLPQAQKNRSFCVSPIINSFWQSLIVK
ncbi:MAG: hypothetical protein ACK5UZ_01390, partial [Pseudanabaena sp.]